MHERVRNGQNWLKENRKFSFEWHWNQARIEKEWFHNHLASKKNKGEITTVHFKCPQKIFKRSPVEFNFVRVIAILDPIIIISCKKKVLDKPLKSLMIKLVDCKILSTIQCCLAAAEFNNFYDHNFKNQRNIFKESNESQGSLDNFFFFFFFWCKKFENLFFYY